MKLLRLFALILVSFALSLILANTAHAATFTVDDTGDASAVDPNVSCDTAGNVCTLRSAIEAANTQAGADTIEFTITGGDVHTITPGSALPDITEQLTIDGSSQPGATCGTLVPTTLPGSNTPHTLSIVVDGSSSNDSISLHFADGSSNSIVRGLVLNHTTGYATALQIDSTVADMLVECNYFGTNAAGDTIIANSGVDIGAFINNGSTTIQNNLISGSDLSGIQVSSATIQNNLIGTNATGTSALPNTGDGIFTGNGANVTITHNVISGNGNNGINMQSGYSNSITANYIGLSITGTPLGNGGAGISAFGTSDFTIGSTLARNMISANSGDGIHIYSNCYTDYSIGSTTINNYIGTNVSGEVQSGYGNNGAGIEVNEYQGSCESVYNHKIGGDSASEPPNIIAGNSQQGILVHQDNNHDVFSVTILGNSIFGNGQFGIDLAADSDNSGTADTDLGPNLINAFLMSYPTTNANYYLNRPTITSTSFTGNQLTVNYNFQANQADNSTLFQTDVVGYRLDFYLNDSGQDGAYAGYNQGKTHIGSFIVNGSETNSAHTFISPSVLANGQTVNATSTVLWKNIPQTVCSNPDTYYGDGPPYLSCIPPQP